MKYDGIIFDFNGVLWWDSLQQEKAWKQFSEEMRGRAFTDDEIRVHVHGRNNRHSIEYLVGQTITSEQLEQLSERKEKTYREMCLELGTEFKLSPGAIDLLEYLEAKGVEHTIATASGIGNLEFFIEHLELEKWFDVSKIVYDDGERPGKPSPDVYQEAAKRLGHIPGRCVVIEDSQSGIEAAREAGIGKIIGLGSSEKHDWMMNLEGVDDVVESLGEIAKEELF